METCQDCGKMLPKKKTIPTLQKLVGREIIPTQGNCRMCGKLCCSHCLTLDSTCRDCTDVGNCYSEPTI